MTVLLRVAARTHVGVVRTDNQDCVLLNGWVSAADGAWSDVRQLGPATSPYVVAVFDGLGGHVGGGVASRIAALAMGAAPWPGIEPEVVRERIKYAATYIQTASSEVGQLRGLGTTVAGVAVIDSAFCVFNVGDTSVYRATGGYVGELSIADRRIGPDGSEGLTQSLSAYTAVPTPHIETFPISRPLRLLVCSDGLTDVVARDQLRTLIGPEIGAHRGSDTAADALLSAALKAGAPDNVSVAVVDLLPASTTGAHL